MERPNVTIAHEFFASRVGNHLFLGEFTWAVTAGPSGLLVIQDKLAEYEAEQMALALNRAADGMRVVMGMAVKRPEQVLIDFPVGLLSPSLSSRGGEGEDKRSRKGKL